MEPNLANAQTPPSNSLPVATPDEFLPPIGRWSILGGVVLLSIFGGAIALAAVLPYKVTVRAAAAVRPEGDIRIVEAAIAGPIGQVTVKDGDAIRQGDILAYVRDDELRLQEKQFLQEREQTQQQFGQIQAQLQSLSAQIAAETRASDRAVAAATARLDLEERQYREAQTTTQADLREAEAAVRFARDEFDRFQQLAAAGALGALQISEKEAALETALARLERVEAATNPSPAAVNRAQREVEQAIAAGEATIARLEQEREALARQRTDAQKQLQAAERGLQQVRLDLEKLAVRSPLAGTIQELLLRNPGQVVEPGEAIAHVAPQEAPLVIQARVDQEAISKVAVGQAASVRIDSCAYTDYGVLNGTVGQISPDARVVGEETADSGSFYKVAIVPQALALRKPGKECLLQVGMEGRADIIVREESILTAWLRKLRLLTDL